MGSSIWVIGCILFGTSQNYVLLIIFSSIIGIGIESTTVGALIYFNNFTKEKNQGKIFSFFITIQGVGALFGIFLASYFEDILFLNWNFAFLFVGFLSLGGVILVYFIIRFQQVKKIDKKYDFHKVGYTFELRSFQKVLKKRPNLDFFILLLYVMPFIIFFEVWLQKYFQEYHSLSQTEAALTYLFFSGGEFLGMLSSGFLMDKYHTSKSYRKIYFPIMGFFLAFPFLIIGFSITWIIPNEIFSGSLIDVAWNLFVTASSDFNIFFSYILLFFGFFSYSFFYPFAYVALKDLNTKNENSVALGLCNFLIILGKILGPLIGGLIADVFSLGIVIILPPFFFLAAGIHLLVLKKSMNRQFLTIKDSTNREDP